MEPFKNELCFEKSSRIASALGSVSKEFSPQVFLENLREEIEPLALKDRVRLIAERIETALPLPPPRQFKVLRQALTKDDGENLNGFLVWPFTEVVARGGLGYFEDSMDALREMTPRFTAEFAIRPFLLKNQDRTLERLHEWCCDSDEHVRRLVSEGSRPLLPWGVRLPALMQNPALGMGLLQKLHADPSAYVRLSVSNHLNDFSKAHPELVLETLGKWREQFPKSSELVKLSRHATRTLVKQGHPGALEFHGFADADAFQIETFTIARNAVRIGGKLEYFIVIRNISKRSRKLLFDYAIHHRKASGGLSPKVFKGRIRELAPGEAAEITGTHSFKVVTTRRYYPGGHRIEPRINGKACAHLEFDLRE